MFRFSDYDLFAYVATGLAAMSGWDIVFGTHIVLSADWTLSTGVAVTALAYVIGQIIASPSAFLLEKSLVKKVISSPSECLMGVIDTRVPDFLRRTVLREYFVPLEAGILARVLERAKKEGKTTEPGEPLFWAAFPAAKKDRAAYRRMETLLKLYGFCRNISFVAMLSTVLLVIIWIYGLTTGDPLFTTEHFLRWLAISVIVAAGMLLRYLKFFRIYSVEVFVAYSEGAGLPKPKKKADTT